MNLHVMTSTAQKKQSYNLVQVMKVSSGVVAASVAVAILHHGFRLRLESRVLDVKLAVSDGSRCM